jgi:hypothetical protein
MTTIDLDIIGNTRVPMMRTDFRKSLKLDGSPKSISNGDPEKSSANPPKRRRLCHRYLLSAARDRGRSGDRARS